MKKSEESLFPFLEKLQSSMKLEGASPTRKVTNSVELDVEFLGRDKEMDLIHKAFENNWKAQAEKKECHKAGFLDGANFRLDWPRKKQISSRELLQICKEFLHFIFGSVSG